MKLPSSIKLQYASITTEKDIAPNFCQKKEVLMDSLSGCQNEGEESLTPPPKPLAVADRQPLALLCGSF